jgi:hypothetical protein
MKRTWGLAFLLLFGCDGGTVNNPTGDWNEAVDDLVAAICVDLEPCTGDDPATCEDDVRADMQDARDQLEGAEEGDCVACMQVLAEQAHDQSFTCDPADIDMDAIEAACGTDNEVCAGFP